MTPSPPLMPVTPYTQVSVPPACAGDQSGNSLADWLWKRIQTWFKHKPWLEMPEEGKPFDRLLTILTPLNNGVETIIFTYQVPDGMDGVIKGVYNQYTGPGFVEGSGDLTWRIRVGLQGLAGRPVLGYSNILTTMGSLFIARTVEGGIIVRSGDWITYTVTNAPASAIPIAGTFINACVKGWFWPKERGAR